MTERAPFIAGTRSRNNVSVLDEWSLVHFGTGFLAGAVGFNAWLYVFGHAGYEVVEYYHEYPRGSELFGTKRPEWDVNMVADMSVGFAGYVLARWLRGDKMRDPLTGQTVSELR